MNLLQYLSGFVYVQIVSADVPAAMNACFQRGITFYDTQSVNEMTVRCKVKQKDFRMLSHLLMHYGCELTVIGS